MQIHPSEVPSIKTICACQEGHNSVSVQLVLQPIQKPLQIPAHVLCLLRPASQNSLQSRKTLTTQPKRSRASKPWSMQMWRTWNNILKIKLIVLLTTIIKLIMSMKLYIFSLPPRPSLVHIYTIWLLSPLHKRGVCDVPHYYKQQSLPPIINIASLCRSLSPPQPRS